MHDTSMMIESPYLRWWFTAVFVLPGLYFLARCLLQGTVATRIGDVLHVLMCAGMIVMVSPAGMAVPVAAHLVVFAGGTLWFAGLIFVEHGNRDWHQVCAAHAHHAIMMAGMVWMAMIMALGGHGSAVPRPIAIVAVVLAVLFLVGGGAVMILSSRTTSGQRVPLSVAADVVMSVGMASMIMVLIT